MNAQLRIQIRVAAAQALAALKQVRAQLDGMFKLAAGPVTGQINQITAALKKMTAAAAAAGKATGTVFTTAGRGTARSPTMDVSTADMAAINKKLKLMNNNSLPNPQMLTKQQIAAANQGIAKLQAMQSKANAKAITDAQRTAEKISAAKTKEAEKAAKKQAQIDAKQLAQSKTLAEKMSASGGSTNRFVRTVKVGESAILSLGKSIQSTGRQLTYNFTYPLVLAGKQIFAFAMANETALTNLKKVYGDAATGAQQFKKDQSDLARVFRDLSDIYGVQQSDIISLAASWAAAGATGYGLAKALQTTAEALNLFDFTSPEEAVKSLISVQTAFKLNANDLEAALFSLNSVENATAVTGADLVAAFVRVGSTAYASGVGVKELAADIAALVPTTGSAETAGNGLKTIFTRLLSPTAQATKAFEQIGLSFDKWKSDGATAQTRLTDIAKAFQGLNDTQRVFIATQIAGRFQANRFVELMAQIVDPVSAYSRALNVTKDDLDSLNVAENEINLKLQSQPQAFKILTTRIQNMLVSAIMPLIPTLLQVVAMIEKLVNAFNNLSQGTKNMIIFGLAILAAIGPVTRITGAFIELFAIVGSVGSKLLGAGMIIKRALFGVSEAAAAASAGALTASEGIVAAFLSPWFLIPAAIAGIFLLFRRQITAALAPVIQWLRTTFDGAINAIVRGFYALPTGIQRALMAVYTIAARIMKGIVNVLSYLNPFARHSPSLVDNVDAGVAHIIASYSKLNGLGNVFAQASADFEAFKKATAGTTADFTTVERQQQRKEIIDIAPDAGPAVDAIYKSVDALNGQMDILTGEIVKQKGVVDNLSISLDAANRACDKQNDILDVMKDRLSRTNDELQAAKAALDDFANAPIAGMKDMNEQIFQNDMAQKQLRLEILKLEDTGGTYDDLKKKIQDLGSAIDSLQGRENDLRAGGAGSEILGFYDEQIRLLSEQKKAYENNTKPIENLQAQLDKLAHRAEELDLEKSLKFDPLRHQIDNLVDSTKELTFEEIVNGINKTKPRVDQLTAAYDAQKSAIDAQQAIVDKYKDQRDEIQKVYDVEKGKLDDLNSTYDAASDTVKTLTGALDELVNAQKSAASASAAAASAGEGANFPAGPPGLPDTTGSLADLANQLDAKSKEFFGKMDFFKPLRDQWAKIVKWWNDHVVSEWNSMVEDLRPATSNLRALLRSATDNLSFDGLADLGPQIIRALGPLGDTIRNLMKNLNLGHYFKEWWDEIKRIGGMLRDEIAKWSDLWEPLKKATKNVGEALKVIGAVLVVILAGIVEAWKVAFMLLEPIVKPILRAIGAFLQFWLKYIHAMLEIFLGLMGADWRTVWKGITDLCEAGATAVIEIFKFLIDAVVGVFKGLWAVATELQRFTQGLQNVFRDAGKAINDWLTQVYLDIFHAFENSGQWLLDAGKNIFLGLWHGMTWIWDQLWDFFFGHSVKTWIIDYFTDAIDWLAQAGINMLLGLWHGMTNGWTYVTAWLGTIKSIILGYVADAAIWFLTTGMNIISGLLNGITTGWESVKSWLSDIKNKVTGVITSPIDWLADSGRKIIGGFVDGMKNAWNSLNPVGWFSNALQGITDLWPFSPAKDGPLKAKPPEDAGYSIGRLFASGMMQSAGEIQTAAVNMVDTASNALATGTANAVAKAKIEAAEAKTVVDDLNAKVQTVTVSGITYTYDPTPAKEAAKAITSSFQDIETKYQELSNTVEKNKAFDELQKTFNEQVSAYENYAKAAQKDIAPPDLDELRKKYKDALDETRLSILDLARSYKEMPAEVQTKIVTLLDTNDIAGAKKALEDYKNTSNEVATQATANANSTEGALTRTSQALEDATKLAQQYQDTINSLDFKNASLTGATQAIGDFNKKLFAEKDAIANAEAGKAAFVQTVAAGPNVDEIGKVTEAWTTNFDLTTEAGRAGLKAIEDLANSMTGPLAQAFADSKGDFESFRKAADEIANDALGEFQNQLGLSSTQVDELRKSLGLTEGDWKARFDLSGTAEAKVKLDLLQSTISGITDPIWKANIQTQILNGDYVGAVNTVKNYFDQNTPTLATTVGEPYNQDAVIDSVRQQMSANPVGMNTALKEPLNQDQFLATIQEQVQANKLSMPTTVKTPDNADAVLSTVQSQMSNGASIPSFVEEPFNQDAVIQSVRSQMAVGTSIPTFVEEPYNQDAVIASVQSQMAAGALIPTAVDAPNNQDQVLSAVNDFMANGTSIPTFVDSPTNQDAVIQGVRDAMAAGTSIPTFVEEPFNQDAIIQSVRDSMNSAPVDMFTVLNAPPNKNDIVDDAAKKMGQSPIDMLTVLNAPPNQDAVIKTVQNHVNLKDILMPSALGAPANTDQILNAIRQQMGVNPATIATSLDSPSNQNDVLQSIQDNLNAYPLVIPTIFGLPLTDFVPAPGEAAVPFASGTGMGGFGGGWAMLGERGRELLHLPGGSTVFNNLNTEKIIRSTQNSNGGTVAQTFNNQQTKSSVNFHGDLSFPNITKADDAEKFIRNLEALANS